MVCMHQHLLSEIFIKPLIACLLKGFYFRGGRGTILKPVLEQRY